MSWSTGLCDCFATQDDCQFCCLATFCSCIAFGVNTAHMRRKEHPYMIENFGQPCMQFMYFSAIQQYSVLAPQTLGLLCCWVSLSQTVLVENMLVVVGRKLKVYHINEDLPAFVWCFDKPCCESFWCIPCVLTRIHHEVTANNITYDYNEGARMFMTNSMFEGMRLL